MEALPAGERANAIIPCTEDDLTNLESALGARELQETIHVVLRMFDYDICVFALLDVLNRLGRMNQANL